MGLMGNVPAKSLREWPDKIVFSGFDLAGKTGGTGFRQTIPNPDRLTLGDVACIGKKVETGPGLTFFMDYPLRSGILRTHVDYARFGQWEGRGKVTLGAPTALSGEASAKARLESVSVGVDINSWAVEDFKDTFFLFGLGVTRFQARVDLEAPLGNVGGLEAGVVTARTTERKTLLTASAGLGYEFNYHLNVSARYNYATGNGMKLETWSLAALCRF
jgi:hypothetical protein